MLAGTFIGTRIIAESRLAAAESLARSSPVPGIKDNMLWLETSLSASIDNSQASDGSAVTSWNDQSINSVKPLVVAVGTGPTYANSINYVHAIKFDGSTANYLQISDASFLNGTDYTIMVIEKRQSGGSNNYFLGETSSNPNDNLALGYSSDSTVIHAQGNQSYATGASVSSYASSTDKPRQFTFVHSSTAGNSTYINGILAAQDATKTTHLSGITTLAIGKGYTGEIGEIAIFARALSLADRQSIEDYAGKKWTLSINRASAPSGSCVGYTITDSGCDLASATCSISQAGISARVAATASSTSIACNQTNYSGNVSYTCISGAANVTGSCVAQNPCTSVTATGSNNAIFSIAHGATGSLTCNATNYTGTATFSCNNGTPTQTASCTCVTGYTGTGCSTCDKENNYVSDGGGTCVLGALSPCTVSGTANGTHTLDTTTVSGSTIHIFKSNGSANGTFTLTCPSTRTAQVLVVGGGGGGSGGGGGGGGVVYNASRSLGTTPISVVVGIGGNGTVTASTIGANGSNSSFDSIIAYGGGGGGKTQGAGASGASSGGCGQDNVLTSGAATQGYSGASGISNDGGSGAGGGGGAGGTGYQGYTLNAYNTKYGLSGQNTVGGNGGAGASSTILNNSTIYYGGGGGGGPNNNNISQAGRSEGLGGIGGGGNGSLANNASGTSGTANTGGGGGGGDWEASGGNGGSGIVIVRYTN